MLSCSTVEEWKETHPREWWAFEQLNDDDELRDRVLLAILNDNLEAEAIDDLIHFAEALEAHRRATKSGTMRSPPAKGERRSFSIFVNRMTRMQNEAGLFFRVDFSCPDGWGGYFNTTNPGVVEKISKLRNRTQLLTVVGEVARHRYAFYVELDDHVRIV